MRENIYYLSLRGEVTWYKALKLIPVILLAKFEDKIMLDICSKGGNFFAIWALIKAIKASKGWIEARVHKHLFYRAIPIALSCRRIKFMNKTTLLFLSNKAKIFKHLDNECRLYLRDYYGEVVLNDFEDGEIVKIPVVPLQEVFKYEAS
jgi:hypothetical protein